MSEEGASGDRWKPSEGEKEQIKLTASYFNGTAIGLILVGGLTASLALNANSNAQRGVAAILSLCSLVLSPYIYLHARCRLRGLDT